MEDPILQVTLGEKGEFLFNYKTENSNSKTFNYAKSFNNGFAFVYKEQEWDIIDFEFKSVLESLKHNEIIKLALKNVLPKDYFYIKNYRIVNNLIISVDFLKLKGELIKKFPITGPGGHFLQPWNTYYLWNYLQQSIFVINIYKEELTFSFIEDITLPGDGVIGVKPYSKKWRYISIENFNDHKFDDYLFECEIETAYQFVDGLAKVKVNGMYGFIDLNGKFVIPPIYDDARSFSDGKAAIAIANCRKFKNDTNNYYSDFRWNFINRLNQPLLSKNTEGLTKIKDGRYYYFENRFSFNDYSRLVLYDDKYGPEYYSGRISTSYGNEVRIHWFNCEALGQLSPAYLIDLLTAQKSEELGFKRWYVIAREKLLEAYKVFRYSFLEIYLPIDTKHVDFDTTQTEIDFINNSNSLEKKYGEKYISGKWKSKQDDYNQLDEDFNNDFETDWTHYNDNLDLDQQSDEFWNQF